MKDSNKMYILDLTQTHHDLRTAMRYTRKSFYALLLCGILALILLAGCGGGGGGSDGGSDNDNISTTIIGPSGGSAISTDGRFKVEVPAGALASDTIINTAIIKDNIGQVGLMYEVSGQESVVLSFLSPVTIKVNYDPNLLPEGVNENGLRLGLLGPFDSWEILTDSTVDKANHIISATTNHFSSVGVLPTFPTETPPKLRFPLPSYNPFSASVSAVFDHSMSKTYCPEKDVNNNSVVAYTGEGGSVIDYNWSVSVKDCDGNGIKDRLYGYRKADESPFLKGKINYSGGNVLYYDGHPGYDYPTSPVDVLAAASGTVNVVKEKECWNSDGTAKNGVKGCYGIIWIDHGGGYSTWYIHLSKRLVKNKEFKVKGERIGISGNTAPFNVGYHLHFEVRKNNIPIDPYSENMWEATAGGYSISGRVTLDGVGLSGVTVTLSGAGSAPITTGANGNYRFVDIANGTYTITPSKSGYTFSPSSRTVTVNNADVTGQDFVGTLVTSLGAIQLPKTGQTTSYAPGDDGDLEKGVAWPSPRFTDNGNGTVTDNLTGLIWLKNANCFGEMKWKDALDAANTLKSGKCGLTDGSIEGDWRLPNRKELRSLIDYSQFNPALPSGHPFTNVQSSSFYWSSTTYPYASGYYAWGVYMYGGSVITDVKTGYYIDYSYVWPVRAGDGGAPAQLPKTGQTTSYAPGDDGDLEKGVAWPSPRFTDNGNGTVTDNLTGLIWLKNANCFGEMKWKDALDAANTLNSGECGLSDGSVEGDWRLPNVNELESLISAGEAYPATWLNTQGFSGVQSYFYWSSTTFAFGTDSPWSLAMFVTMSDGLVSGYDKASYFYVWPVRAGTP